MKNSPMMKRILVISGILVAFLALYAFNRATTRKNSENSFTEVKKDVFEITVSTSGELIAEQSVEIKGPDIMQSQANRQGRGMDMRMADLKIQDIVAEGTMVKAGDYIAQLDRTSYSNSLKDAYENLTTRKNSLDLKILDTAVVLTNLRDQIKNQKFAVEEAEITLAQSKYEPPATIRQAEINLDKAKRALEQQKRLYKLKVAQNLADIRREKMFTDRAQGLVSDLEEFLAQFTVIAPSDGMVLYKKDRTGAKRKAGSSVNMFDRVIATLPDLSTMLSKMYVSEIEVAKVKPGQKVSIAIDAMPGKTFMGKVYTVANIGEVLPNADSKMFEVQIKLDNPTPDLRPAMTTTNKIFISTYDNVLSIPTECVLAGTDSIPFVYLKNKTKQIVVLGEENEKNVIIEKGLEEGENVYLNIPSNAQDFRVKGEELIPEIKKHRVI